MIRCGGRCCAAALRWSMRRRPGTLPESWCWPSQRSRPGRWRWPGSPDSLIEIGASTVVIWELSGTGQERQRRGLSLIGSGFAALACRRHRTHRREPSANSYRPGDRRHRGQPSPGGEQKYRRRRNHSCASICRPDRPANKVSSRRRSQSERNHHNRHVLHSHLVRLGRSSP